MRLTYQYRILPTKAQQTKLNQTLELCRWVYNESLATRKNAWEQEQKSISRYDTFKMIPKWKEQKPELNQVYTQVLRDACTRVDLGFKAFFRRVKAGEKPGYPRFRGYGRYDSFTYTQKGFKLIGNELKLSRIGNVKIIISRPLRGTVKTLNIRRDSIGNWYANFSCEVETEPLPKSEEAIGIDMGIKSFVTLSDGTKVSNPRFLKKDEKELAKAQRKLSKAEKGTPERAKRRKAVAHIYQRIANRRKDFAHKLSRNLVNEYGIIALEKLNNKKMLQNHYLAKSIADAAWNQLVQYIQYKAACADRECVLVDPCNTSKRCSRCGTLVEKSLSVRVHKCPVCNLQIDRDENAALNILALGLQCLGESHRSHVALEHGIATISCSRELNERVQKDGNTMNKLYTREDIIREVARRAEFTIKDTKDIFIEFEKLVREIVAEDSELKYRGMFDIKGTTIKPHMGYDVNTKERKMLEGKKRLVITPGDALRKIYKESGTDASEESETTETDDWEDNEI